MHSLGASSCIHQEFAMPLWFLFVFIQNNADPQYDQHFQAVITSLYIYVSSCFIGVVKKAFAFAVFLLFKHNLENIGQFFITLQTITTTLQNVFNLQQFSENLQFVIKTLFCCQNILYIHHVVSLFDSVRHVFAYLTDVFYYYYCLSTIL